MDTSKLADRLRAIVRPDSVWLTTSAKAPAVKTPDSTPQATPTHAHGVEALLGGEWCRHEGLTCFVVERRRLPETAYGCERVGGIAARLAGASAEAPLVLGGIPARLPFVFFDLETTGLSGGAGTCAFLVGCGSFDDDGAFVTRQFLLLRHADERPLLQMVALELARAGVLVTFNGKSFDAPLIETRYLFHRLPWTGGELPHLDVLHPARRFWIDSVADDAPCSLVALERVVLGAGRTRDVSGGEIPGRYFQFIRTGDARPLVDVLEHNRSDLFSLAALTARLLELVRTGPAGTRHAREALALGRLYARGGLETRAREAYERACHETPLSSIKIEALRSLALLSRRRRLYDDAASRWRELLDVPGCPVHLAREASHALAVHHEHRARDLAAARAFAVRSFDAQRPAWNQAVQHRLARLDRKMSRRSGSTATRSIERPSLFPF